MSKEKNLAILSEIRKMARELPVGSANAIINRCNKVESLMKKGKEMPMEATPDPVDEAIEFERQKMTVYNWLIDGHTVTSREAFKMWGITRLSARIMDIEKMTGTAPNRRRITVKNRNGRNVSVCEYWIDNN
jgi:hypothetical protein